MLDEALLRDTRRAAAEFAFLRRDAQAAEAAYFHSVRRLHAGGGSLQEIADATGLPPRRIREMVQAAGGGPGIPRRKRGGALACSFCGKPQKAVHRLNAGPGIYICDGCVADARSHGVLAEPGDRCSFCARAGRSTWGFGPARAGQPKICASCLAECEVAPDRSPG